MAKTNVPIVYGLVRLNDWGKALQAESADSFPHAEKEILAGCIVGPDSPTIALIYVCQQCQTARQKWESEHEREEVSP